MSNPTEGVEGIVMHLPRASLKVDRRVYDVSKPSACASAISFDLFFSLPLLRDLSVVFVFLTVAHFVQLQAIRPHHGHFSVRSGKGPASQNTSDAQDGHLQRSLPL